jgi:excisionase family DNA binding protein
MTQPLTVKQAADRLGYHPNYVRRLLREGTIKGQRFSTIWMVEPEEVESIKSLQGPGGRLPKRRRS